MDVILGMKQQRRQQMAMTMHQAVRMLQMPQLELAQWLQEEIESNPLLEHDRRSRAPLSACGEGEEPIAQPTLREHLLQQARDVFANSTEISIAVSLIDQCDERGFLIAGSLTLAEKKILQILQTFDPPGICARSLQESFVNQLRSKKDPLAQKIIREHFHDLLSGRFSLLRKKMRCSPEKLREALHTISQLASRPAVSFESTPSVPMVADLSIVKLEQGWLLTVEEQELPLVSLRPDASSLLAQAKKEEKETVRNWLSRARWLQRALCRRRDLLRRIAKILIRTQSSYFAHEGEMIPISIEETAQYVHVHPSTVWRAIVNKVVASPRGMTPLSRFFATATSKASMNTLLQRLISQEDKKRPLTDEELMQKIQAQGFACARRTVAHYRKRLKLRSSLHRKA
jgi:RNA polymerase sigma-54 factor